MSDAKVPLTSLAFDSIDLVQFHFASFLATSIPISLLSSVLVDLSFSGIARGCRMPRELLVDLHSWFATNDVRANGAFEYSAI